MTFLNIMPPIVNDLKTDKYNVESDKNGLIYIVRGNIVFGSNQYPCDTAISEDVKQPDGAPAAIFSTYIHSGLSGEKMQYFTQLVGLMNYRYLGKFVNDFTDQSQDLLYVTRERLDKLSRKVVDRHLLHHAQVKAQVTPAVESIASALGLEKTMPGVGKDPAFQEWAEQFVSALKLHSQENIQYVPVRLLEPV